MTSKKALLLKKNSSIVKINLPVDLDIDNIEHFSVLLARESC